MKTINFAELINLVANTNATNIVMFVQSEVKMNKTNNPFYHKEGRAWVADEVVEKLVQQRYMFGIDYQTRVNSALVVEGEAPTFKADKLPWGEWEIANKVIRHNGKYYLRTYVDRVHPDTISSVFFVDGNFATPDEIATIKEFTPTKSGSARQANEGLAEDKQVIPNNVDFDKIISIEIEGVTYNVAK